MFLLLTLNSYIMQKYKMPINQATDDGLSDRMLLPMCMFAQQITVQGVVKDQTSETVIGIV